jgi:hypothetical protein
MLLGGWCWSVSFDSVDIFVGIDWSIVLVVLAVIETRLAKRLVFGRVFLVELVTVNAFSLVGERPSCRNWLGKRGASLLVFVELDWPAREPNRRVEGVDSKGFGNGSEL